MIGGYLFPPTWLHGVPAGVKLLGLAIVATVFLALSAWWVFTLALAISLALYISLGAQALSRFRAFKPLLALLALIYLLQWYVAGHEQAFVSVVRLLLMVVLADIVTMTTPLQAMLDALQPLFRFLEPVGANSHKLSLAVALVIRFIPVLFDLWARRSEAWRARSSRRVPPNQIGLFIATVLTMADHIAEALDSRGYGRTKP